MPRPPVSLPSQPTIVAPVTDTPRAVEQTSTGPRSLLAPSTTLVPTDAETVISAPASQAPVDAGQDPAAADGSGVILPPNGDGVVYTTFGIQAEEDEDALIEAPELNIEGLGAGD